MPKLDPPTYLLDPPSYYLAQLTLTQCIALVAQLAHQSCWFQYMPLPGEWGQIMTKAEPPCYRLILDFRPLRFDQITGKQMRERTPA